MNLAQAQARLAEKGQSAVLRFWDQLDDPQRQARRIGQRLKLGRLVRVTRGEKNPHSSALRPGTT